MVTSIGSIGLRKRVFVASSSEGLDVAYAVQENLEYHFEVTVWPQGVFDLTKAAIEILDEQSRRFDAAIFVFSPDDISIIRKKTEQVVRDNVIFELGLFIGRLGRENCFIVRPRSIRNFHIPSDLLGVNPGTYDDKREDGSLVAALGPTCNKIRRALTPAQAPLKEQPKSRRKRSSLEDVLTSAAFRLFYNPPTASKRIVFAPGGRIIEGNNQNEHSWRVAHGKLELLQLDGQVHSRFNFDAAKKEFTHTNDDDTRSVRGQFIVLERAS